MNDPLREAARSIPGAISRRMSPGNHLRWLPTLDGNIIKPGGASGVPFGGYGTRREAITKAKDIRETFKTARAEAMGES